MRCVKCGRLPFGEAPKWAFSCCCKAQAPLKETLLGEADFVPKFCAGGCGVEVGSEGEACSVMCAIKATKAHNARVDKAAAQAGRSHTGLEGLVALAKREHPDQLVAAIRADKVVGMGTCSRIDECYSDKELAMALAEDHITTVAEALKWAREDEGLFLEQGLNQRWGEDADPQLANFREFQAADKENPVEDAPSRNDGLGLVWDDED